MAQRTQAADGKRATIRCPLCLTLNRVDLARAANRPQCGECGKPILIDRPVRVTEDDFARMISETEVPVLVDFYADWCGPCKLMAPLLDDVARARLGELLVAKLDTDRNPGIASRFGIRGIPTLILFHQGKEVARRTGAISSDQLEALLSEVPRPA